VRDILRNRMYCGDMVQGKKRMEGRVQITLPKSEWTITENTHEAIVSRDVYAEVQKFWENPKTEKEPYYKGENTVDIYRAKLFCGDCGSQMFRKRTGNNTYSYLCTKGVQYTKRACGGMRTTDRLLNAAVLEKLLGNKSFITVMKTPSLDENKTIDSDVYKNDLARVKSDIEKNSRFLKGLYESLVLGDISEAEYRELKNTYEIKMASLAEQESLLRGKILDSLNNEKAMEDARSSTISVESASDLTLEVITQTVESVTIHERERIEVTLRFGADAMTLRGA